MFSRIALPLLTVLLWLTTSTSQVDVSIVLTLDSSLACFNLLPGQCCTVPLQHSRRQRELSVVTGIAINHLLVRDVGIIFTATQDKQGCDNMPPARNIRGPGHFSVNNPRRLPISGVSYIRFPQDWPPDVEKREILAAQALLHLEAQGQQWTAPGVSAPRGFFGLGSGRSGLRKVKRGVIAGAKGTAFIGAPRYSRYPDQITVKGVDYRSADTSALEYKDTNGNVLDLSTIGL